MARIDVIHEFREDHRKVRDDLLVLAEALNEGNVVQAQEVLSHLDHLIGPHFRFEEEALYPALRPFLGDYVDQLLREHDTAIQTAENCATLLQKEVLTPEERAAGAQAARSLLIHVSNCDGLAILSERLSQDELDTLGEHLLRSREAGVPLLTWARTIRSPRAGA